MGLQRPAVQPDQHADAAGRGVSRPLREGRAQVGAGEGRLSIHEIVRAKEAGLENLLVYDPYRRVSLRDHFLPVTTSAHDLWSGRHHELG
ncbi:MAG: DUF1926 domain-containing protein, partial [Candidatus Hydrogenedentes bacterium]|nr:DUF1926 domain-containing protein [Candidatus Hydrogenedentota bacterium]